MLPANAAGIDPWGGAITVAPDANANYVDISLAGVPSNVQALITSGVANGVQTAAPYYTAGTSTWKAGF